MPHDLNRRRFLRVSAATATLAAPGIAGPEAARGARGFRVGAGQDRHGQELLIMGGRFDLKVSAGDTGGDLCIFDTRRDTKGGPALHRHFLQDGWSYMVRGEFLAKVGDDLVRVGLADSAFAPRGIPHTFAKEGFSSSRVGGNEALQGLLDDAALA